MLPLKYPIYNDIDSNLDINFLKEIANEPKYGRLQYNARYILDILKFGKKCMKDIYSVRSQLESYIFNDSPYHRASYKKTMQKIYCIMEVFNDELQKASTFQLDPEKFGDFFYFMNIVIDYADNEIKEIYAFIKKAREIYE